jgi:hypothetical protein
MKEVEKMLSDKKLEIDNMPIPKELEARLRGALGKRTVEKRSQNRWRTKVAGILIAAVILGYHIDTLAYYGKTLIGYDEIMNSPLKKLNELGKGQVVGKTHTFTNGVTVTLDGIMLDANQLLAFYTIKSPDGNIDEVDLNPLIFMKGIVGRHHMNGASGKMNDSKTEIKWIAEFDPPYFFEKKLSFNFNLSQQNTREIGEIAFILDRNKAMKHTLKKVINQTVKVDDVNIRFEVIKASPTITHIQGKVQNILELAADEMSGERIRPGDIDVKLLANGKEVQIQGGGMSTNMKGITFEKNYEALPSDLESLQLKLVSFVADHDVKNIVELEKGEFSEEVNILGQNIAINRIYESKGDTYVTITTEENVTLSRVHLILDGKRIKLQETLTENHDKKPDGTITHTRTLHFRGVGDILQLEIQRIKFNKTLNKIINISVE